MPKKTDNAVILSGGSRGLGLAIVESLLNQGNRIGTFSRGVTDDVQRLRERFGEERFYFQQVDATNTDDLRAFVEATCERFGRLDGLINNAAVAHDGVLATMPDTDIAQVLDVNLRSVLVLTRECVRKMLVGGNPASIINISSIVGTRGFSGLAAYSATKAGLLGMTRSLARELGARQIRVNAIAPGYLITDMSNQLTAEQKKQIVRRTPLGRLGTPDDVTACVRFLLSKDSDFITGQVLCIDGGATV